MPSARSVSITLNGIRDGCHCMRWCLLFRIMIVLRQSKRAPLYARETLCAVTGHSRSRHVRPGPRGPWPCISVANPKEENRKSPHKSQNTQRARPHIHTPAIPSHVPSVAGIFRNIVAAIFRDILRYSPIFSDIPEQLHAQGCRSGSCMRRQPGHAP